MNTDAAIKRAWITAAFVATWTLVWSVIGMLGIDAQVAATFNAWSLIDVVLSYALASGIYRRSWICAFLMLVLFVYGQFSARVGRIGYKGLIVPLIIAVIFTHGA